MVQPVSQQKLDFQLDRLRFSDSFSGVAETRYEFRCRAKNP
jgi:hypothetical protein